MPLLPKLDIFKNWEKNDPDYQKFTPEQKIQVAGNYFDGRIADDDYRSWSPDLQKQARNNFIQTQITPDPPQGTGLLNYQPPQEDSYLKTIGKGVGRGIEGMAQGVGSITRWAGEAAQIEPLAEAGKTASEYWTQAAQEGVMKPDPVTFAGTFWENPSLKRAIGIVSEAVPSLVAAYATGGAGMAAGMTKEGAAKLAGYGLGLLEGAPMYEEARAAGKDVGYSTAIGALATLGTGWLEGLPIERMLKTGKGFFKGAGKGALEEGIQEGAQQIYQNLIAKLGYDDTRELSEGLIESIIGGAGSGGMVGGVVGRFNAAAEKAKQKGVTDPELNAFVGQMSEDIANQAQKANPNTDPRTKLITEIKEGLQKGTDATGKPFTIEHVAELKKNPDVQALGMNDELNQAIIEKKGESLAPKTEKPLSTINAEEDLGPEQPTNEEPEEKTPWRMNQAEYQQQISPRQQKPLLGASQSPVGKPVQGHEREVVEAIARGEDVPPEVIAEYRGTKWADEILEKAQEPALPEAQAVAPEEKKTQTPFSEGYRDHLSNLLEEVKAGKAGRRLWYGPEDQEKGVRGSIPSTYPKFMQDKGWTGKEVETAIEKGLKGEFLYPRQKKIFQTALDEAINQRQSVLMGEVAKISENPAELAAYTPEQYDYLMKGLQEEAIDATPVLQAKAALDQQLATQEGLSHAQGIGTETGTPGEQAGIEGGEEGRLYLRDAEKNRLETGAGEEGRPPALSDQESQDLKDAEALLAAQQGQGEEQAAPPAQSLIFPDEITPRELHGLWAQHSAQSPDQAEKVFEQAQEELGQRIQERAKAKGIADSDTLDDIHDRVIESAFEPKQLERYAETPLTQIIDEAIGDHLREEPAQNETPPALDEAKPTQDETKDQVQEQLQAPEADKVVPYSERTPEEKKIINDYNKKLTTREWEGAYKTEENPHWAQETEHSPLAEELKRHLEREKIKSANVLEIGTGNGRDSIYFAKNGHNVKGIDVAQKAVDMATENAKGTPNVSFEVADAEALPYEDASFDAVYSVAALHSTPIKFTFGEINRVLKPGGIAKLFLYTSTKTGGKWISYWTPGEIKQYAKEAGLKVERFREGHDTEPIEIPGIEGKVDQETHLAITTLRKPKSKEQVAVQEPKPEAKATDTVQPEQIPETKPKEEPSFELTPEPTKEGSATEEIQDFGQKIGGARKDLWKERGLQVSDLDGMTQQERETYATKANVWPSIDYEKLVEDGMSPEIAYLVKAIKDSIALSPQFETLTKSNAEARESQVKHYIEIVSTLKEKLPTVRTVEDIRKATEEVFPSETNSYGYRRHYTEQAGKDLYLVSGMGLRKFSRNLQPGSMEQRLAILKVSETGFPSKQEAWKKRYDIHVSRAGQKIFKNGQDTILEQDDWYVTSKKSRAILQDGFASKEEAEAWARDQAKAKDNGPRLQRPFREALERTGPDYREDKDVTPEDILTTFGFRGGEFGNWTNQADRQQSLNEAYDGLMDLARVLDIPPKAVSLNGELGIAFGARGGGWASAHYEPGRVVINLTKTRGAGALAHEWGHAIDDYFGRIATAGRPGKFLSHGEVSGSVRPEVLEAWKAVMKAISHRTMLNEESAAYQREQNDRILRYLNSWLKPVEEAIAGKKTDAIRDLLAMLRDEKPKAWNGENIGPEETAVHLQQELKKIDVSLKRENRDAISNNAWHLEAGRSRLAKYEAGDLTRQEETDFLRNAKKQGKGKGDNYWSRKEELFARAFESHVEDRITDEGTISAYLVHSTNAEPTSPWGMVYPQGKERKAIGSAFQNLFDTIQSKETEKGTALFSLPTRESSGAYILAHTPEELQKHLDPILKNWKNGPTVDIVQGYQDLPPNLFRQMEREGYTALGATKMVEGLFDPQNPNHIYIIADNITSFQDLERKVLHEAFHYGARKVFGSRLDPLLNQVYLAYGPKKLQDIAKLYKLDLKTREDRLRACEEMLARMAEKNEKPKLLEKLYALVRSWLREMGFNLKLSDAEIRKIVADAARTVEEGGVTQIRKEYGYLTKPGLATAAEGGIIASLGEKEKPKSNIQRIAEVAIQGPELEAENLSGGNSPEIINNGKKYYMENLLKSRFFSPALNEDVTFTSRGLAYLLNKGNLDDQARRFKLLPRVVPVIKHVSSIDKKDVRKVGENHYRYGLYGRFKDGLVVSVILDEIQLEGKKFLSIYDVEDLKGDKLYKKMGLLRPESQPISGGTVSGQPSAIDNENVPLADSDVNSENKPKFSLKDYDQEKIQAEEKHYDTQFVKDALETGKEVLTRLYKGRTGWKVEKPDSTWINRLAGSPEFYFEKVPAAQRTFEAALRRPDNYYHLMNQILETKEGKSLSGTIELFQKERPLEYKRLQRFITDADRKKITYQAEDLKARGFSDQAVAAWSAYRKIMDNGFDLLSQEMRDVIQKYTEANLPLPTITVVVDGEKVEVDLKEALLEMGDMRGYYAPRLRKPGRFMLRAEKKGSNPILEFFDSKTMADFRGTSLEREGYTVTKQLTNRTPEDVFELAGKTIGTQAIINQALERMGNKKPFTKLKDFGLTGTWTQSKDNQSDFVVAGPLSKKYTEALKSAGGKWYAASPGEQKVWHFVGADKKVEAKLIDKLNMVEHAYMEDEILFATALATQVANIVKGRGFRSSMIKRGGETGEKVWTGYEEDPLKSAVQYARNMAAGTAKKEMALKMVQAVTGTDIDWKTFDTYEDYLEAVKERKIDAGKQPNIFHDTKIFMEDMLRNEEFADRVVGTIKGIAVLKYLAGRISSPFINLTALVSSVPANMSGYAKIPIHRTFQLLGDAAWKYGQYLRGDRSQLNAETVKLFDEIRDKGWHTAQFNKEALAVLRSKVGQGWDNLMEWSMVPFGVTEQLNRVATIAGTYAGIKAITPKNQFNHDEALALAKKVSDRAHGVYGKTAYPHLARGQNMAAQVFKCFYVFKKFSHTYLQTMIDLGFNKRESKSALYMMATPAILAGAGASVAWPLLMAALKKAFDWDDPEEEVYGFLDKYLGEYAGNAARFGVFGMGSHGVTPKGSLAIGITDIPTTLPEVLGAPGSVLQDVFQGGKSLLRGDVLKGVEKLAPSAVGSAIRAVRENVEGVTTGNNTPVFYGNEQLKSDNIDSIVRFLGFNPSRMAKMREKLWTEKQIDAKYSGMRQDLYARIKRFYLSPESERSKADWLDLLTEVNAYNDRIKEKGYAGIMPFITGSSIRRAIKSGFTPSRSELLRRAAEEEDEKSAAGGEE